MPVKPPLLFVYGTLLSGAGHPMGRMLQRNARLVGCGSVQARLYDFGWFPGAVLSAHRRDRVFGEVYALAGGRRLIDWLDRYEMTEPQGLRGALNDRVEVDVRLATGRKMTAYMYVTVLPTARLRPVPGGDWLTRR